MAEFQRIPEQEYQARYAAGLRSRFSPEMCKPRADEGDKTVSRLMMRDGKKLVGVASLYETSEQLEVGMLEIAVDKRRQGYGPQMLEEIFRRAAESKQSLNIGEYIGLGKFHLKPHEERLTAQFPGLVVT